VIYADEVLGMIGLALLATSALISSPAETVYHCQLADDGVQLEKPPGPTANGWDMRIVLTGRDVPRNKAYIVAGPLFSSSRGVTSYSSDGTKLRSKTRYGALWNIETNGRKGFSLVRDGMKIEAALAESNEKVFLGTWHMSKFDGHILLQGGGEIGCVTLAQDEPVWWEKRP
jgi:hypothetical protein